MSVQKIIVDKTIEAVFKLFGAEVDAGQLQIERTGANFKGDFTLVVFPLVRYAKRRPEETATVIGDYLLDNTDLIASYEVVKGFLNLTIEDTFWKQFLFDNALSEEFGLSKPDTDEAPFVIEYSSPNTNKPLHLGHIRNNLLGWSVAEILKASGKNVVKVNLINDRGIHICKSMLAWKRWGEGETPGSAKMKGDHLIGKYYVRFDQEYKKEVQELVQQGMSEDKAKNEAPLMKEAREMLRQWEEEDVEVRRLWEMMNSWVYLGFNETYTRLGVDFDKFYYESQTYLLGKSIVHQGLKEGVLIKKEDGSVWADLRNEGLDEKILLRSDGTSVYMTQDLGTAKQRYDHYKPQKLMYVVGNEQNYHFEVLAKILKKLGKDWSDLIYHLSYGMVELPHGKMKSREGTVVDADDLMDEMYDTAKKMSKELGKTDDFSVQEQHQLYDRVSLGALKYYMLKVDPKRKMMFNPQESIDFNGNTGPFIQYTYARIRSLIRKAEKSITQMLKEVDMQEIEMLPIEKELILQLYEFPAVLQNAADNYSPAMIANYAYDLTKMFNSFYQDKNAGILKADDNVKAYRLLLSAFTASVIKNALHLLGIKVVDRM
jgi:arginyl-tRNA synthetase